VVRVSKKRSRRRPTTYKDWVTEDGLAKIAGWARDGLVNEQIAQQIGIHPSTLYDWQNKYPEIAEALKQGKEVIDRQVESALLKRALGYEYEEVKMIVTESGGKRVEKTRKQVLPDVGAQIFWLKNRKPKEWRDRQEVEHSGDLGVVIVDDIPKG
jgi:transposase-like protein